MRTIESQSRAELHLSRGRRVGAFARGVLAFGLALAIGAARVSAAESYAIAMHGTPALPADFTHMPYANPDAPKGGRLVLGRAGTFDSLNPLIVKGLAVQQSLPSADARPRDREPDGARQ